MSSTIPVDIVSLEKDFRKTLIDDVKRLRDHQKTSYAYGYNDALRDVVQLLLGKYEKIKKTR